MPDIARSVLAKPIIIFSKLFAVFPLDTDLNINTIGVFYTTSFLTLAVIQLYFLPSTIINIENQLTKVKYEVSYNYFLKMLFPSVVFFTSIALKINCLIFFRSNLKNYAKYIHRVDPHLNIKKAHKDQHRFFSTVIAIIICLLTFPINFARLRLFYIASDDWVPFILFSHMYLQNISSCWNESQFATITYGLLIRVHKINEWLQLLSDRQDILLQSKYQQLIDDIENVNKKSNYTMVWTTSLIYLESQKLLTTLTKLRALYKDLCEAAVSLKKAYRLSLLFSLCSLSLMLLFDLYFEFFGFIGGVVAKPLGATYIWCLQYCVRFILLVEIPQKIYQEVGL